MLTELTEFWLQKLAHILPNHSTGVKPEDVVAADEVDQVRGRAVVVKRLKPILVEAVARGYLIGSGWKDYQATGSVCGIKLPAGLQQASQLPEPIFTPAAKAEFGMHDENVDFAHVVKEVGQEMAERIRDVTLKLYTEAARFAATKGIIIADTKFEFGLDDDGTLYLMDEVLTPDSSRFWPADGYRVGISPPSFDKQFVRDWLETDLGQDAAGPAPASGCAGKDRRQVPRGAGPPDGLIAGCRLWHDPNPSQRKRCEGFFRNPPGIGDAARSDKSEIAGATSRLAPHAPARNRVFIDQ